jgi:hypothetical protein
MSSEPGILDGYISRPTLAKQLDKSERTIERWGREQIGPPVTFIGKQPFYNLDSVREWLRSCEQRIPRKRGSRNERADAAA